MLDIQIDTARRRWVGLRLGWLFALSRIQIVTTLLSMLMVALSIVSILIGTLEFQPIDIMRSLFEANDETLTIIVQEIRLPRAILAILIGATLGISGAALQGLLRNPLADPALLGTSSSAALGAVLSLYFGFYHAWPLSLPLFAVGMAIASILLLFTLAGKHADILTLILSGVALSSFSGAAISVAINLSADPHSAMEIVIWLMGSLSGRSMTHVWLCLPFAVIGCYLMLRSGQGLDALSLGEEAAHSLGVRLKKLRLQIIVGVSLAVGGAVAVAGSIGFVGLVIPHLLRPFVGHRPSTLLWMSGLGGAVMMLAADIGVRVIPTNPELKLGVLTALVGVPFFIALVIKTKRDANR